MKKIINEKFSKALIMCVAMIAATVTSNSTCFFYASK